MGHYMKNISETGNFMQKHHSVPAQQQTQPPSAACHCAKFLNPFNSPNVPTSTASGLPGYQHYCRICNIRLNSCRQATFHVEGKKHQKHLHYLQLCLEATASVRGETPTVSIQQKHQDQTALPQKQPFPKMNQQNKEQKKQSSTSNPGNYYRPPQFLPSAALSPSASGLGAMHHPPPPVPPAAPAPPSVSSGLAPPSGPMCQVPYQTYNGIFYHPMPMHPPAPPPPYMQVSAPFVPAGYTPYPQDYMQMVQTSTPQYVQQQQLQTNQQYMNPHHGNVDFMHQVPDQHYYNNFTGNQTSVMNSDLLTSSGYSGSGIDCKSATDSGSILSSASSTNEQRSSLNPETKPFCNARSISANTLGRHGHCNNKNGFGNYAHVVSSSLPRRSSSSSSSSSLGLQCKLCQAAFPTRQLLEMHKMEARHFNSSTREMSSNSSSSSCSQNKIAFNHMSLPNLSPNKRLFSNNNSNAIKCEVCQVSVNSLQQLEAHLTGQKHRVRAVRQGLKTNQAVASPSSSTLTSSNEDSEGGSNGFDGGHGSIGSSSLQASKIRRRSSDFNLLPRSMQQFQQQQQFFRQRCYTTSGGHGGLALSLSRHRSMHSLKAVSCKSMTSLRKAVSHTALNKAKSMNLLNAGLARMSRSKSGRHLEDLKPKYDDKEETELSEDQGVDPWYNESDEGEVVDEEYEEDVDEEEHDNEQLQLAQEDQDSSTSEGYFESQADPVDEATDAISAVIISENGTSTSHSSNKNNDNIISNNNSSDNNNNNPNKASSKGSKHYDKLKKNIILGTKKKSKMANSSDTTSKPKHVILRGWKSSSSSNGPMLNVFLHRLNAVNIDTANSKKSAQK